MRITGWLLELLFPSRCAFCGAFTPPGREVCGDCEARLPRIPDGEVLRRVGAFDCAVAFYYDGPVREGVLGLKFRNKPWRARVFGGYVAQAAAEHLSGRFDAVTYVPVSFQRRYRRGYDQARLLAQAAARVWGVKAETTLRKTRNTRPQSGLDDPEARRANAAGVYAVPHPERVAGRRFLLIDDVCTTGSTLASCAGALMAAGAESVVCAALAGGHRAVRKADAPPAAKSSEKVM